MSNPWYTRKWVAISLHVLFWSLIFAFPFILRPLMDNGKPRAHNPNYNGFYYLSIAGNLVRLIIFYLNAYLFIPLLIYRKRYAGYVAALLGALGALLLLDRLFFQLFIEGFHYNVWSFFAFNLPFFLFVIVASSAFRVIKDRVEETQRNKERETENLRTELAFLRSQVSPHFMFNIMNNMVALARKKSDLLEPSLIKLSSLLRYMLYETAERVSLQKEIEYLQSYIDLQRQRFGSHVTIEASLEIPDQAYEIEPMLLIPFVENAFKHGTGSAQSHISIELSVENHLLRFTVRNTVEDNQPVAKDGTSGIGLANVQRRLALLYGEKHSLLITRKDNWFIATLQIVLN